MNLGERSTNPHDLNIPRFETKSSELDIRTSSVARRVRWKQLMKENAGKINLEPGKEFEADHYDTYLNTWGSACGIPFDAKVYLDKHLQFYWINGLNY